MYIRRFVNFHLNVNDVLSHGFSVVLTSSLAYAPILSQPLVNIALVVPSFFFHFLTSPKLADTMLGSTTLHIGMILSILKN